MNTFILLVLAASNVDEAVDFVTALRLMAACCGVSLPVWWARASRMQRGLNIMSPPGGLGAQLGACWRITLAPLRLLATHFPQHHPLQGHARRETIIQFRVRHIHAWRERPLHRMTRDDTQSRWQRTIVSSALAHIWQNGTEFASARLTTEGCGSRRGRLVQIRLVSQTLRFRIFVWEAELELTEVFVGEDEEWSRSDSSEEYV